MSLKNISFKPTLLKAPPFSVEAPGYLPVEGETIPRRHPLCKDGLKSVPEEGITTVFDILLRSAEKFGQLEAVGTRSLIQTHVETKKVKKVIDGKETEVEKNWSFFEMGNYEYLTYQEYVKLALEMGAGLRKLGLKRDDRVHIFASTR